MDGGSLLIIRGIVGLVIGILAVGWPHVTVAVLVALFGVYAILDGIANLVLGSTGSSTQGRSWGHVLEGVVGIVAGVMAFVWPTITAFALVVFIGAWALVTGVFEIVAAIRLRKIIRGEWLLALSGVMSVLLGLLIIAFPGAGALGIAWILGVYAAIAGVVLIALGVRMRSLTLAH